MSGWVAMVLVAAMAGGLVLFASKARKLIWQPLLATLCLPPLYHQKIDLIFD